jgi:hypothetical protein
VIGRIVYVLRNGLRWRKEGVFAKILQKLSKGGIEILMVAHHLKVHRTVASLKKGASPRHIGRRKERLGSKLHVVCDAFGYPVRLLLTAGDVNGIVGAGKLSKDPSDKGLPEG